MEGVNNVKSAPAARWYVIQTYAGYESVVKTTLIKLVEKKQQQDLIQDVFIPMHTVTAVTKSGQLKERDEKIFPSYVLVKMIYTTEVWHTIKGIRGAVGFLGSNDTDEEGKPDAIALTPEELWDMGVIDVGSRIKLFAPNFENWIADVVSIKKDMVEFVNVDTGEVGFVTRYHKHMELFSEDAQPDAAELPYKIGDYIRVLVNPDADYNKVGKVSDIYEDLVYVAFEGRPLDRQFPLNAKLEPYKPDFKVGDSVKVTRGIYTGACGTVTNIDLTNYEVTANLIFASRPTPITMSVFDVVFDSH